MKRKIWQRLMILGLTVPTVLLVSSCNRPEKISDGSIDSSSEVSSSATDTFEDVKTVDISPLPDPAKMEPEGALRFTFSDGEVSASETSDHYEITGTALKIKEPGTYILTGTCADGSVTVAKETTDVFLILDGLSLTSSTGSALTCNKSSSVCIYLQPGSENTLSDPATEHEEGAAVKFKSGSAVLLTGGGSLSVFGNSKNGIKGGAGAIFQMLSGNLTVKAKNNALACDHSLQIDGGQVCLTAENDGIKSSPDEGDTVSAGNIYLNGGSITVNAVGDGISAEGLLSFSGGTVDITTTGEISVSTGDSSGFGGGFGGMGFPGGWGSQNNDTESETDHASSKGIKSGTAMKISGGTLSVSSTDHALHCGGDTVIEGGVLTLNSSKAKGIATHGNLTVSGDQTAIVIENATEGIESKASFTLNGGMVEIHATDDGVNMGGSVSYSDAENHAFTVNGGTLSVFAQGDGLDSNGTFHMNGGTVSVFGPSNGGNSCLDIQFLSSYTGGTLLGVAASSSMWNEVVGHTAGEYLYTLSGGSSSGNVEIQVCDADGKVLISGTCPLRGNIGIYFMTDQTDDLSSCYFMVNGTKISPQSGNGTGSGGMGGFNPGGGDHGGGPGGGRR